MLTGARAHLYLAISESIRVLLLSEWHRLISTIYMYIENISILPIVISNYSSILFILVVHCI